MGMQIIQQPDGAFAIYHSNEDRFVAIDATPDDLVGFFLVQREHDEGRTLDRHEADRLEAKIHGIVAKLITGGKPYFQFTKSWSETLRIYQGVHGQAFELDTARRVGLDQHQPHNGPTLALIACVKSKLDRPAPAGNLYTSRLFRGCVAYAAAQDWPWKILSAEHGLLAPETEIAPYERTLNAMPKAERDAWAARVLEQLAEVPPATRIVFLAGRRYREGLVGPLRERGHRVEVPMEGLGLFTQVKWLAAHRTEE